jgi:PEGA domain-containing protein
MRMVRSTLPIICFLLVVLSVAEAKDTPGQTIQWPETGQPVLRFVFGKFKEGPAYGHEHNYTCDTTAQNLWDKKISSAVFTLYVFDKNNVRIGEGYVQVSNLGPGEVVKFQTSLHAAGIPATMKLNADTLPAELRPKAPPRTVSITINSVPQGAGVKVDGEDLGTTPKIARLAPGKHLLEFSKEGFNPGKFPLEIGPDDASGGSVSYELGTLAHDTVELRDGTVLVCDVDSMSGSDVVMHVGGAVQRIERNKIKRILLVERDAPASAQ